MKKIKKKRLILFGVPIVLGISILSLVFMDKAQENTFEHQFVIDVSEKDYRKVYLLDENKYLIPLSVEVSGKEYIVDEIYKVVSNLRDLEVEGFHSVLEKDVKINKIDLNNGILNIDFSKEFLNYPIELEEKIIESLTFSVLDFKEIRGLTITIEGVKLEKMPQNGLVLPNVLDKNIGINKYHDMAHDYKGSDNVVVLYQKTIGGNTYYVPVTRKVIKEDNDTLTVMNALDTNIAILSGLEKLDEIKNLNMSSYNYDDMKVNVNLSEDYLIEDNMIDSKLYEILMVTFSYNNLDMKVSFSINEEVVEVNGYNLNEDYSVADIIFNEIEI